MLPFTTEQFFGVFASYNQAIWPAQIIAYLLGAVAVALLLRPGRASDRIIAGLLALMWLWTGVAYHWLRFATINRAALLFGGLFVAQAALFVHRGVARGQLRFGYEAGPIAAVGIGLIAYAAIIYPLLGLAVGHAYPQMPMFGTTPCPVTIFTFGLLLLTVAPVPRLLLVIPLLWSLIGGTAAFLLGVPQDWVLLFSGLLTVPLILLRDRRRRGLAQVP